MKYTNIRVTVLEQEAKLEREQSAQWCRNMEYYRKKCDRFQTALYRIRGLSSGASVAYQIANEALTDSESK